MKLVELLKEKRHKSTQPTERKALMILQVMVPGTLTCLLVNQANITEVNHQLRLELLQLREILANSTKLPKVRAVWELTTLSVEVS